MQAVSSLMELLKRVYTEEALRARVGQEGCALFDSASKFWQKQLRQMQTKLVIENGGARV